jgi:hypothetical protein
MTLAVFGYGFRIYYRLVIQCAAKACNMTDHEAAEELAKNEALVECPETQRQVENCAAPRHG